jgi:hypothetical protein
MKLVLSVEKGMTWLLIIGCCLLTYQMLIVNAAVTGEETFLLIGESNCCLNG